MLYIDIILPMFCLYVFLKGARLYESHVTMWASVGLLPSVYFLVSLQVTGLVESHATVRADIRFLSCVDPYVSCQVTPHCEGHITLCTSKGSLAGMRPLMNFKIGGLAEVCTALGTYKRPQPSMNFPVKLHIAWSCEGLAALRAGIWFLPCVSFLVNS